jgi:hypothetical protein
MIEYKGHQCWIVQEVEEDNIKAFHYVRLPSGEVKFADISPYNYNIRTIQVWIDADYPNRVSYGPLTDEDLEKIIEDRELAAMFGEEQS